MSEPFLGEIRIFAGNFAPRGWAFCNGQILAISTNTALFSLLGTTYGGNGQNTFALPNLQSRIPVHAGQAPGLSLYDLGEAGGEEGVTLTAAQMPAHAHPLNASTKAPSSRSPVGNLPGAATHSVYSNQSTVAMSPQAISPTGGSQPHENRQPFLAVNFIIALTGIFPSRN